MSRRDLLEKFHVVCLPIPTQSHIGAMLKIGKLLHHRGLSVTFVNTEFNHRRLLDAKGPAFLADLPPGFRFLTVPDGLPPSRADATQDIASVCESTTFLMAEPFCELIGSLVDGPMSRGSGSGSGFPPVSCIVADGFMTFTSCPAGDKFGIPVVNLWTMAACTIMCLMHLPKLRDKGLTPPRDHLDTMIHGIPGINNMKLGDMPRFPGVTDPGDVIFNFMVDGAAWFGKPAATVMHTFEPLEPDVLTALSSMSSGPVLAIGPFQTMIDQIPKDEDHTKNIGINLWKEDAECLRWLDSQQPESVLYVNFGSIAFLTSEQLVEFAMGIAGSKHPFLLIMRPDLVKGDSAVLPPEFIEQTKDRAFITGWCSQEEVLNHSSVAGFLTHCGWNSVIESLSSGVPMLCWPYFSDQITNCKYVCEDWGVGLKLSNDVNRDDVQQSIKVLMEGQKGKQMKSRASEWKRLALEATSRHGSSSVNLDKLVHLITSE